MNNGLEVKYIFPATQTLRGVTVGVPRSSADRAAFQAGRYEFAAPLQLLLLFCFNCSSGGFLTQLCFSSKPLFPPDLLFGLFGRVPASVSWSDGSFSGG